MNTFFLNETTIQEITNICETYITKDVKRKIRDLQKKYNIEFTLDIQTNRNLLWMIYHNELMERPDIEFSDWFNDNYPNMIRRNGGTGVHTHDCLRSFIKNNHNEDYQFICKFDISTFREKINTISKKYGFYIEFNTLNELIEINDYHKYISDNYGIKNVDKKILKNTQRLVNFFDELLEGIPNKNNFINNYMVYTIDKDLSKLHRDLNYTQK